ncbi:MAG: acetyl-CoA carboxylase biotin carboxyl carrier protein [Pseudomonadota bacterium]
MGKFEVDDDLVRKLADLLNETGLTEIEFEADDRRIRVSKGTIATSAVAPAPVANPVAADAASAVSADVPPAGAVPSPMVGTVYLASEPSAPPFVKVGDTVREGQTLMIIEAMKVMNPLASPRSGKVTQVLVNDGEPVEFGQPLLVVE